MSETTAAQSTAVAVVEKIDNGKPALYNPAAFDQIWRASKLFASSDLVPVAYKGKPENCFIAIEMADRMGISPFAMLQSLVIIQGKPSMEAKLIIALVNDSGIFKDPLEFEVFGEDPHAKSFKVRAVATLAKTGKLCQGPWITYQMVEGEGWLSKQGSKWKTMPDLMFRYRAASYFAKIFAPNITMGMQTREEMEDVTPIDITPRKEAPPLVALEVPEVVTATVVAPETPAPTLVDPIEDAVIETVDESTGEITETVPVVEPEKKKGRGKQAAAAVNDEPPHPADLPVDLPVDDPEPEPDTTTETTSRDNDNNTNDDEPMGDLF